MERDPLACQIQSGRVVGLNGLQVECRLPIKSLYFGNATVNVDVRTCDDRELSVQHRLASRALLSCIPNEGHFSVLLIYRF